MKRRRVLAALMAVGSAPAAVFPRATMAQRKVPVIGLLWNDTTKPSPWVAVFLDAMRDRGYVLDRDFRVEDRVSLEGYDGYAASAAELVRAKVDVIVVNGTTGAVAAAKATKDIPIVALLGSDPVARGLAASLSRPGGNLTGVFSQTVDLTRKRIEILKELVPGLSKVGVVLATNVPSQLAVREVQTAAAALNLQVQFVEVATPDQIESRIGELARARVDAIYVASSTFLSSHSNRLVAAVGSHRIPALYPGERYAAAGAFATFSTSTRKGFVRLAGYVDRILKGARPGDLPIEQTTDFEMVINLKTAKALGITVPQSARMRADRVIE